MRNTKVLWLTRTAIFIAVLLVVQYVTKAAGQYVTGSLVNLILVTAALTVGLSSGLAIAVLSPFFAFLFGIGPVFIQLIPMVALGNAAIVAVVWLIMHKYTQKTNLWAMILAVIAGAVAKFGVLWLGIVKIVLPLIPGATDKQISAMTATFTWPQLITALIGATIAMIVVPLIARAIKKAN